MAISPESDPARLPSPNKRRRRTAIGRRTLSHGLPATDPVLNYRGHAEKIFFGLSPTTASSRLHP
jgi:hypothetical protein